MFISLQNATVVLQYSSFRGYRHASFKSLITVNPLISPPFQWKKVSKAPSFKLPPFPPYSILLASPKNKQTNKQKERRQGHRNSCGQLQQARILIKKKKEILKKTAIQEKLQLHTTSYWTRKGTSMNEPRSSQS